MPRQVLKFNGEPVRNLRHLAEMVLSCTDRFMRFELSYHVRAGCLVVLGGCCRCLAGVQPGWTPLEEHEGADGATCCRAALVIETATVAAAASSYKTCCGMFAPSQEILVIETAKVAAATEEIIRLQSIPSMVSR